MQKLSHKEVVGRQVDKQKLPRLPFVVVLNNIRSLYNVGSIFRSADGAGLSKVYLCGITGYPPNSQISKTALGAESHIDWEYKEDAQTLLKELKRSGYKVILLEQTDSSIAYNDFFPDSPVCMVLGNEVEGVSSSLIELCDQAIEIEMEGMKNSLNVSVAFGIVAFDIKNKFKSASDVRRA